MPKKRKPTQAQRLRELEAENKVLQEELRTAQHPEERQAKPLSEYSARAITFGPEDFGEYRCELTFQKIREPYRIIFLGDLHFLGPQFASNAWETAKKKLKSMIDEYGVNCGIIGMGDYFEFERAHERAEKSGMSFKGGSKYHDAQTILAQVDILEEELAFTKGRWLAWLEGNHYGHTRSVTSTQILCDRLGGVYLGKGAWICFHAGLPIAKGRQHGSRTRLTMLLQHNIGGGGQPQTPGTALNQPRKARVHNQVDIVVAAHNHALFTAPITITRPHRDTGLPIDIIGYDIGCGGFQLARKSGKEFYIKINQGMRTLGFPTLDITPYRKGKKQNGSLCLELFGQEHAMTEVPREGDEVDGQ